MDKSSKQTGERGYGWPGGGQRYIGEVRQVDREGRGRGLFTSGLLEVEGGSGSEELPGRQNGKAGADKAAAGR